MFLLLLCRFVSPYLFLSGRGIIQNSTLDIQNLERGLPGGALGDDVGEVGEGFGGDDVEGDGTGHEYVVVVAVLGAVAAVGSLLVDHELVARLVVALDIGPLAHGLNQSADEQGLGRAVGMEADIGAIGVGDLVESAPTVDVAILRGQTIEHKEVRVGRATAVGGLESITLDNEQCLVVEPGDGGTLAGEHVVVDMAAPLRHDLGQALPWYLQHGYYRPVGLCRTATHIDSHHIAAMAHGQLPDGQGTLGVGNEARA